MIFLWLPPKSFVWIINICMHYQFLSALLARTSLWYNVQQPQCRLVLVSLRLSLGISLPQWHLSLIICPSCNRECLNLGDIRFSLQQSNGWTSYMVVIEQLMVFLFGCIYKRLWCGNVAVDPSSFQNWTSYQWSSSGEHISFTVSAIREIHC